MIINPFEINYADIIPELGSLSIESVVKSVLSGTYDNHGLGVAIRHIIKQKYPLSMDEISQLQRDISDQWKQMNLALAFARCGYPYSQDELIFLDDPNSYQGWTVSKEMKSHLDYKAFRQGLQRGKLQLTYYKRGHPVFRERGGTGKHLGVDFDVYEWDDDHIVAVDNQFHLQFKRERTNWSVELIEYPSPKDRIDYAYHQHLLIRLTTILNQAVQCRQEYDLSAFEKVLDAEFGYFHSVVLIYPPDS